ncbi:hypothetical protein ACLOJK_010818 [Asimina triloba]
MLWQEFGVLAGCCWLEMGGWEVVDGRWTMLAEAWAMAALDRAVAASRWAMAVQQGRRWSMDGVMGEGLDDGASAAGKGDRDGAVGSNGENGRRRWCGYWTASDGMDRTGMGRELLQKTDAGHGWMEGAMVVLIG